MGTKKHAKFRKWKPLPGGAERAVEFVVKILRPRGEPFDAAFYGDTTALDARLRTGPRRQTRKEARAEVNLEIIARIERTMVDFGFIPPSDAGAPPVLIPVRRRRAKPVSPRRRQRVVRHARKKAA